MLVSPFTFDRGAAKIMAADLKDTPRAGMKAQLCGDAHLSNFGVFASPERNLLFDLNDFDETLAGPFEYVSGNTSPATGRRCRSVAGGNRGASGAGCQVASRSSGDHPRLTQTVQSHRGGDVLVQPEQIGGVVFVLQFHEPPVCIRRVRRPDERRIRFTCEIDVGRRIRTER